MITVDIELLPEHLLEDGRSPFNIVEEIIEFFPYNHVDHEVSHKIGYGTHILIQLAQDELTIEQEKFLDKEGNIREYNIHERSLRPTLDQWQVEAINDILTNDITRVPSNGIHTRFYTECLESEQWDNEHHLIDLDGRDAMYSTLTISQMTTSGSSQVKLSHNEVDDLLTALLRWRLDDAKRKHDETVEKGEEVES